MPKRNGQPRAGEGNCSVDGCTGNDRVNGMCSMHNARNTNPMCKRPLTAPRYTGVFEPVGYVQAHARVKRLWGSAGAFRCVECGAKAHAWAYDNSDPTELLGKRQPRKRFGMSWYSIYPEFYMPLCRRCHFNADIERRGRELEEYRVAKYEARVGADGDS